MISSGHPNAQSDLENPLGLMISEDDGETWDQLPYMEKSIFTY